MLLGTTVGYPNNSWASCCLMCRDSAVGKWWICDVPCNTLQEKAQSTPAQPTALIQALLGCTLRQSGGCDVIAAVIVVVTRLLNNHRSMPRAGSNDITAARITDGCRSWKVGVWRTQ